MFQDKLRGAFIVQSIKDEGGLDYINLEKEPLILEELDYINLEKKPFILKYQNSIGILISINKQYRGLDLKGLEKEPLILGELDYINLEKEPSILIYQNSIDILATMKDQSLRSKYQVLYSNKALERE